MQKLFEVTQTYTFKLVLCKPKLYIFWHFWIKCKFLPFHLLWHATDFVPGQITYDMCVKPDVDVENVQNKVLLVKICILFKF